MASNIELFDRLVGNIFADLYESFPIPRKLSEQDYSMHYGDDGFEEFFKATLRWLSSAGFIDLNTGYNHLGPYSATLTNKALEALKIVPDSLASQESLGERLTKATRDGFFDQARSLTGQVLGFGARLGYSAIQAQLT